MANSVWHTVLSIELDLTRADLGHPGMRDLWDRLYRQDRAHAAARVPVSQRGLQCAGVCRAAGVVAWMHLRQRENGRREAVHEKAEDQARHTAPMSDEHKAYQERIVRAAEQVGFRADTEVRTPIGPRSWIQSDTLVEGLDGRRIGWEVQLSTTSANGPRSVRDRAGKARTNGITPAWHTDRQDYARRNDTQWTYSNNLPAEVIAKIGDLRVVSGFRALDIWRCDLAADYVCPDGRFNGCGKMHATAKPRDVLFDDLVRKTAAGIIVPLEYKAGSTMHRFWVSRGDQERYYDAVAAPTDVVPVVQQQGHGSQEGPTCRPRVTLSPPTPVVDWRDRSHWLAEPQLCRYCKKATSLVDDDGRPTHKVCYEKDLQRAA